MDNDNTDLAVPEQQETALSVGLNQEEAMEMFGESQLDATSGLSFNRVKIIRETGQFEIREKEFATELFGHILFRHRANQWWKVAFEDRDTEDSPIPQCYSIDGIKPSGGEEIQAEMCCQCIRDAWGSGKEGVGKACRNTERMLFLQDDAVMPVVLIGPPTSLKSIGTWANDVPTLVDQAYKPLGIRGKNGGPVVEQWTAHVELSLDKTKSKSDMEISVLKIRTIDVLAPKDAETGAEVKRLFSVVKQVREAYEAEIKGWIEAVHDDEGTPDVDTGDDCPV